MNCRQSLHGYFAGYRREGHTEALVIALADALVREPERCVVLWVSSFASGDEIRRRVFEQLIRVVALHEEGCGTGDAAAERARWRLVRLRILSVADALPRWHGLHGPAFVDNGAMLELLAQWSDEVAGLQRTLTQRARQIDELQVDNRNLHAGLQRYETQLRSMSVTNADLTAANEALEVEVEVLRARLADEGLE